MDWFFRSTHISQKGSALFIILIAVALFAALSYVVSNMMRSGSSGTNLNEERAEIYASEILDYARNIRQTLQDLKISNGCSNADISFENTIVSGYANGTNTDCQIFHANGGGLSYVVPPEQWIASINPAPTLYQEHYFTAGVVGQDIGTSDNDLVYYTPYISRDICIALNDLLGIDNPGGEPPVEAGNGWPASNFKFTGDLTTGGTQLQRGGAMSGCFEGNNAATTPPSGTYSFYQVLIAR